MDGQLLLDKKKVKHVHLVGIGGIGLSAIARVLHQDGYVVSGCDTQQTALTADLRALGMDVRHGHHPVQGVAPEVAVEEVKAVYPVFIRVEARDGRPLLRAPSGAHR